jgi:hypothetical protein
MAEPIATAELPGQTGERALIPRSHDFDEPQSAMERETRVSRAFSAHLPSIRFSYRLADAACDPPAKIPRLP